MNRRELGSAELLGVSLRKIIALGLEYFDDMNAMAILSLVNAHHSLGLL